MRRPKKTFKELMNNNRKEIEKDLKTLEKIEEKVEGKFAKIAINS